MANLDNIRKLYKLYITENNFGYKEDEILLLEKKLNISLPKVLRNYYLNLGKNMAINYSHNRLLKPNTEIGFSNDRYLIFYEENQSVVYWGIKEKDLKLDNPIVWGNYGTDQKPDWHIETKTTEDFFLLMAINNGTFGGLQYNANSFDMVKPETVKKIRTNWIAISELCWHKQQIYTTNFSEVISLNFDEIGNCTAIFIGTSHKEQFDYLINTLNINWSYVSYDDDENIFQ